MLNRLREFVIVIVKVIEQLITLNIQVVKISVLIYIKYQNVVIYYCWNLMLSFAQIN